MKTGALGNYTAPPSASTNRPEITRNTNFSQILDEEQKKQSGISSFADLRTSLFGFEPEHPGRISLSELEFHGRASLEQFNVDLLKELRNLGVDTEQELELGTENGSGRIIVTNDHKDKEKIEAFFDNNPSFRNEYIKSTLMLNLAERGKHTSAFAEAYSQSPEAAVAQYSYLFNSDLVSSVTLKDGEIDISFEWTPKQFG